MSCPRSNLASIVDSSAQVQIRFFILFFNPKGLAKENMDESSTDKYDKVQLIWEFDSR